MNEKDVVSRKLRKLASALRLTDVRESSFPTPHPALHRIAFHLCAFLATEWGLDGEAVNTIQLSLSSCLCVLT